jgi:hypothetical protein
LDGLILTIDQIASSLMQPTFWLGPPLTWLCLVQFGLNQKVLRVVLSAIIPSLTIVLFVCLSVSSDDPDIDLFGGVESAQKIGVTIGSVLTFTWGLICGSALELIAKWRHK